MHRIWLAALGAVAIALTASGCGAGSGAEASSVDRDVARFEVTLEVTGDLGIPIEFVRLATPVRVASGVYDVATRDMAVTLDPAALLPDDARDVVVGSLDAEDAEIEVRIDAGARRMAVAGPALDRFTLAAQLIGWNLDDYPLPADDWVVTDLGRLGAERGITSTLTGPADLLTQIEQGRSGPVADLGSSTMRSVPVTGVQVDVSAESTVTGFEDLLLAIGIDGRTSRLLPEDASVPMQLWFDDSGRLHRLSTRVPANWIFSEASGDIAATIDFTDHGTAEFPTSPSDTRDVTDEMGDFLDARAEAPDR